MRQYAIIGLGTFGQRMLERLAEVSAEIIIADKDEANVERYKDLARFAYILDAMNEEGLRRVLPDNLDVAVVDLGGAIEATILVINSLKKLGVREIIAQADSDERGEILGLVGATRVVYPEREAASRIVPLLASPTLFSFMPIGPNLVMAEVRVPERFIGMSLIEANLRKSFGVNVIAIRPEGIPEYRYFNADYKLITGDLLLLAGSEEEVMGFCGITERSNKSKSGDLLRGLLKGKPRG